MRYRVDPLEDSKTFLAEWAALYARASGASFFLSPPWVSAWLASQPKSASLWRIAGLDGDRIVLLGAIGKPARRRPPLIGPEACHLHEFGLPEHDAVYIENNDFLVAGDAPAGAREEALKTLLANVPGDELVLRNTRGLLAGAAKSVAAAQGLTLRTLNDQPLFEINLAELRGRNQRYLESLKGSLRSQIRRSIARYEERGPVQLKIADTADERAHMWRTLMELHEAGWRARGKPGVFANRTLVAFHERLMEETPQSVHLMEIRCGDEALACLYNFVWNGRAMNYQSGFRFEEDNQLKPGMVAHALAAQHYLEQEFDVYDLLAGEALYKRRLAAEGESLTSLVLEKRGGVRAGVRRLARNLRARIKPNQGTHRT